MVAVGGLQGNTAGCLYVRGGGGGGVDVTMGFLPMRALFSVSRVEKSEPASEGGDHVSQ